MYYKRNEPFRYTFGQPVKATMEVLINDQQALTSQGIWEAYILDISPNGMKISTSKDVHLSDDVQIRVAFVLNDTQFEINGRISWKKNIGISFEYGILENNTEGMRDLLISELKVYSKKISHQQ